MRRLIPASRAPTPAPPRFFPATFCAERRFAASLRGPRQPDRRM